MACFTVTLSIEVDADSHKEAAECFRNAFDDFACQDLFYKVTGHNSPETAVFVKVGANGSAMQIEPIPLISA